MQALSRAEGLKRDVLITEQVLEVLGELVDHDVADQ